MALQILGRAAHLWHTRDELLLANASSKALSGILPNVELSMDAVHQLQSAASAPIQVASIVLPSINITAAIAIAVIVCWDCYDSAKARDAEFNLWYDLRAALYNLRATLFSVRPPWTLLKNRKQGTVVATQTRSSGGSLIDVTHVFPLVLSLGILTQGAIFLAAQTQGLGQPFKHECASISGSMLPALFIVPYIQLVFGLETTFQALRRQPFPKRFSWTIQICLLVILVSLVVTYSITRIRRPSSGCIASLFWFLQPWAYGCLIAFLIITLVLLLCVLVIVLQLHRTALPPTAEREAASNLALYLCLGSILNVFIIPFFVTMSFQNSVGMYGAQVRSSMVAMVADNLTGIVFGSLYLYLRHTRNTKMALQSAFADFEDPKLIQESSRTQALGSVSSEEMRRPTPPPKTPTPPESSKKPPKLAACCDEKPTDAVHRESATPRSKTNANDSQESFQSPSTPSRRLHSRKDSYSLFPAQKTDSPIDVKPMGIIFPASEDPFSTAHVTHKIDTGPLPLPPKIHVPGSLTHHGGSSTSVISSATVQIGLETSNANQVPDLSPPHTPRTALSNDDDDRTLSPDSPEAPSDADFISRLPKFAPSPERQCNAKRSPIIESRSYPVSLPPHSPVSLPPHSPISPHSPMSNLDSPRCESISSERWETPLKPGPPVYHMAYASAQTDERIGASIATILEGQSTDKAAAWI